MIISTKHMTATQPISGIRHINLTMNCHSMNTTFIITWQQNYYDEMITIMTQQLVT